MNIFWFRPTLNGILYILPTITYIEADVSIKGTHDTKMGKVTIVNFVWLYWSTVMLFNVRA